jgi:hypothetical protein
MDGVLVQEGLEVQADHHVGVAVYRAHLPSPFIPGAGIDGIYLCIFRSGGLAFKG